MRSMTGFGLGEAASSTGQFSVEIRSVNHRYLDVRVRMPKELADRNVLVEHLVRDRLSRGRIDVHVHVTNPVGDVTLDLARAREGYRALCELRDVLCPGTDVPLSLLLQVPNLFVSATEREPEVLVATLTSAIDQAVANLLSMRQREGEVLGADLADRLQKITERLGELASRVSDLTVAYEQRLRLRIARFTAAGTADPVRIEQEIAILAERSDIAEELTRLSCHAELLVTLLRSPEPAGRKIDFLLQEMAREINTIAAKSQDAAVAHVVVDIKTELERMREQVQNVE